MEKMSAAKVWSLNYRLLMGVINDAAGDIEKLGLEIKEFFVLADIEESPYPAELAEKLCMPKPTITVYLKNLEAKNFVKREIDSKDLRRHRLVVTASGKKAVTKGLSIFSNIFGSRLSKLTASERNEFQKLLEKLI